MPERETRPTGPGVKTSAGMMPALQRRGVMSPGPLGPTSGAPRRARCAVTSAMSRTGMPSVTQTTRPMPASAASIIASRAKRAGTKSTATSAPVAATAARDGVEDGHALDGLAALARRDAGHDVRARRRACAPRERRPRAR